MDKIKIGIIGAWGLRGFLASFALSIKDTEVVALCDIHDDCLEKSKKYYTEKHNQNPDVYKDYKEMLKRDDINAVFVTSPDYMHKEHAVAALNAGKHVYLEKPMAITLQDCDLILETAYKTGSKLFLGHNMRYFPVVLKMKEIIDSGIIGNVQSIWCRHFVFYGGSAYFKDWHSQRKFSNGLLLQKGSHDIDVIHYLADSYTKTVVGMGKLSVYDKNPNRQSEGQRFIVDLKTAYPPDKEKDLSYNIDVEDHSMILMQLENGVQSTYMQSMYAPTSERNYVVIGDKGQLENIGDGGDCKIDVYTDIREFRKPSITHHLKPVEGTHGGSDPEIVKAFINFIKDGVVPNISPVAARMSVACGIGGTESIRSGNEPRHIKPLPSELVKYFNNGQKK